MSNGVKRAWAGLGPFLSTELTPPRNTHVSRVAPCNMSMSLFECQSPIFFEYWILCPWNQLLCMLLGILSTLTLHRRFWRVFGPRRRFDLVSSLCDFYATLFSDFTVDLLQSRPKWIFGSHFASFGLAVCIALSLTCSRTAKDIIVPYGSAAAAASATGFLLSELEPLLVQRDEVEPVRVTTLSKLLGEWFELVVGLGLFYDRELLVSTSLVLKKGKRKKEKKEKNGTKRETYSCPEIIKALHRLVHQHVLARLYCLDRLLLDVHPDDPLHFSRRRFPVCAVRSTSPWGNAGKSGFDHALGQVRVCDGQSGEHDLAGRVVKVGVGDDGAELENGASFLVCSVDFGFL